eukprot:g139.t1
MGAVCGTSKAVQPANTSPGGNVQGKQSGHKASLEGWLKDIKDCGDVSRNLHDIYDVDKRPLGHGATSTVYKCTHKQTKAPYACKRVDKRKMIALYSSQRGEIAARMRAEIEISFQLQHQHLIKVKDVFETKSHVYVIMEMMEGGELFDYVIEKSNLKESEASAIIKQVTLALYFMHNKGIIHRDLKPENVMLRHMPSKSGKRSKPFIKIIDFGMSKALSPGRNAQSCLGTPGYMAPEVLEHKDYTSAVDMYSLGVVSYILLAGYMPLQTAEGQWHSRVIYPAEEWADVSDEAKDFINKLVVYDPKKRMSAEKTLQHPWLAKVKTRRDSTLMSSKLLANPLSRKDLRTRRSSALLDMKDDMKSALEDDIQAVREMQEELIKRNSRFVEAANEEEKKESPTAKKIYV